MAIDCTALTGISSGGSAWVLGGKDSSITSFDVTILIVDNLSVTAQLYQFHHTLVFGAGRRQVFFSAGSYNNHRDGEHFITNKEDFVRKQYVQSYEMLQ